MSMQNSNQNSENESLPFACNESKRKTMFKFRDDEEDKRKTMNYSDSALTRKKDEKFSLGEMFRNSACVTKVDEKLPMYTNRFKKIRRRLYITTTYK